MSRILVATDFSDNANHALRYSIEINKKLGAEIILFHSVSVPLFGTEMPLSVPTEAALLSEAVMELKKLAERLAGSYNEMVFSYIVTAGPAEDRIRGVQRETEADYMIIGTRGASGLNEYLFGRHASHIIGNSICPVIAVPECAMVLLPKKIVYATRYPDDDFVNISHSIDFARAFKTDVCLLHVVDGRGGIGSANSLTGLINKIRIENEYPHVHFKLIKDQDTFKAVNEYLEAGNADLFAIAPRERRFYNRSLTKRMVYHTHVPLMALAGSK
jgi:nucleotide-binding universal stress UspA family protein